MPFGPLKITLLPLLAATGSKPPNTVEPAALEPPKIVSFDMPVATTSGPVLPASDQAPSRFFTQPLFHWEQSMSIF